jgi:hypothetical protein
MPITKEAIATYLKVIGTEEYQPFPALIAKIESVSAKYSNQTQQLA